MTGNPEHGADELGENGQGSSDPRTQRERLVEAFTRVAVERGYEKTTVEEVSALAGVPSDAFDAHFSSKRQCLSAAYDAFLDRLMAEAQDSVHHDHDWPLQVKGAVAGGLDFVAETATRARFFAVEALDAGPLILERYMSAIDRGALILRAGREHCPDAAGLPSSIEPVLIGGVASLVSSALLDEEPEALPSLAGELVEILLTPYIGPQEAKRIAA